jgi:pyochelin synthetase
MDPSHWVELIQEYEITIWNSVPAFMQILTGYFAGKNEKLPLRIVLLSGDWIPACLGIYKNVLVMPWLSA